MGKPESGILLALALAGVLIVTGSKKSHAGAGAARRAALRGRPRKPAGATYMGRQNACQWLQGPLRATDHGPKMVVTQMGLTRV